MYLRNLGKKGINPLIATILLLAFAVAITTVFVQINPFHDDCDNAGISIMEIGGEKSICLNRVDRKIVFDIVNSGYPIDNIKISVVGAKENLNIDNVGVKVGKNSIQKVSVPYDPIIYGDIIKVIITPRVNMTNSVLECPMKDDINSVRDC